MQSHLVAFEYGTGAVWGFVTAPSIDHIAATVPELDVVEAPPSWMTEDDLAELRNQAVDIEGDFALDRFLRHA